MIGNFDFNNDEVMNILNNPGYTDVQKKELFERYKSNLKEKRRKEIISRLNECAKNNPIITEEEYVGFIKKYNDDDLSKPFEIIEKELETFKNDMQAKYDAYMKAKEESEKEEPVQEEEDIAAEIKPDVTPVASNPNDLVNTVFNEEPIVFNNKVEETNELKATVFEENDVKEVMPEDIPEALNEKGNASAIIISIIAIIIGMVIMYSIIKLK